MKQYNATITKSKVAMGDQPLSTFIKLKDKDPSGPKSFCSPLPHSQSKAIKMKIKSRHKHGVGLI